ncbi:hypothetical protein [Nocardia iowensis]|uniref:Uncharacterized protein n=1 Tax=Nocardia iowensis TaxID=204891 RepID=A0ABX8RNX0_NOCIO|nr:hypothetical protein [Nocardia iowensis]QXN90602.1 hypothetical protein KV110_35305 [Nocardia iowensis]
MKKTFATLAIATMLMTPAAIATATPIAPPTTVADTGSASTGSAAEYLCRVLRMLRAGYVDSSGGGPACTFP